MPGSHLRLRLRTWHGMAWHGRRRGRQGEACIAAHPFPLPAVAPAALLLPPAAPPAPAAAPRPRPERGRPPAAQTARRLAHARRGRCEGLSARPAAGAAAPGEGERAAGGGQQGGSRWPTRVAAAVLVRALAPAALLVLQAHQDLVELDVGLVGMAGRGGGEGRSAGAHQCG
jgi:hypothetical protein